MQDGITTMASPHRLSMVYYPLHKAVRVMIASPSTVRSVLLVDEAIPQLTNTGTLTDCNRQLFLDQIVRLTKY